MQSTTASVEHRSRYFRHWCLGFFFSFWNLTVIYGEASNNEAVSGLQQRTAAVRVAPAKVAPVVEGGARHPCLPLPSGLRRSPDRASPRVV
ncbi:hypothetical protein E2C01_020951 [Portunus trituberculatus]|uniref:Uncharacterized protein n=1 Tax=Portunus trituberculatus TaxID=210409 RepID=A0A5B7E1H7_PORTR|nr:hypothetical protein [Portunus trituberculatus]